jgi:hypothetical protein
MPKWVCLVVESIIYVNCAAVANGNYLHRCLLVVDNSNKGKADRYKNNFITLHLTKATI